MSFAVVFGRDLPFGRSVGVALPEADAPDDEALRRLHPDEAAHARALSAARRVTWVGGRLALRAALDDLGAAPAGPILATARGAPALPPGLVGSISHKPGIAVALAARADAARVGVGIDVELERGPRRDIASLVLTEDERRLLPADPAARARVVLVAFSAKEAVYKALDPWLQRRVLFREVAIARAPDGALSASLHLASGEGPFTVELHEEPAPGLVLVAARATRQ